MNFIVFDLETTCWDGQPHASQRETIEIGAVKINPYGEIEDKFVSFVRPLLSSSLSVYCKNLTGIEQQDVDKAEEFQVVSSKFSAWMGESYHMIAWGKYDKKILLQDAELHGLNSDWVRNYVDAKKSYRKIKKLPTAIGFSKAIIREFEEFEGTEHRAYDDAFNLAKLVLKYFDDWLD